MHTLPLDGQTIRNISEEAAYNAGKKPYIAPAEIFPHVYQALNNHLGGPATNMPALETPTPAPSPLVALQAARVALDNCVQVMSKDLDGLKLIQPELASSRAALAKVEAAIEQLQPADVIPANLLDDLLKLNGMFPYDDASNTCRGDARVAAEVRHTYPLLLINKACDSLGLERWLELDV